MSTSIGGHVCVYCGSHVFPDTGQHWCPQMNPNQSEQHHHYHQPLPSDDLARIATALERIANILERTDA